MNTPEEARGDGRCPQASGSPGSLFLDVPSRLHRGQCTPARLLLRILGRGSRMNVALALFRL